MLHETVVHGDQHSGNYSAGRNRLYMQRKIPAALQDLRHVNIPDEPLDPGRDNEIAEHQCRLDPSAI